jgi:hypothetical protein
MKTITAFKTSDGRVFEVESQAHAHEFGVTYNELLIEFFNGHCSYKSDTPTGSVVRRAIIEWEMFQKLKKGGTA